MSKEVGEYAVVQITCHADGKPPPQVYWQKFGTNITANNSVIQTTYNKIFQTGQVTRITAELKFNRIRHTDTGGYSCLIYNSAGQLNLTTTYTVLCMFYLV